MRELIYFTGQIDNSFFINEIVHFCKAFDKVHVVAYGENEKKTDEIALKYGFTYDFVNTLKVRMKALPQLAEWNRKAFVREEVNKIQGEGIKSLQKKAYIWLYELFAIASQNIINEQLKQCDELFLYSFWLSRPAFAIAYSNIERNPKIKCISARTHRYDLYEEENALGYLPFRKFISENIDTLYFSSKDTYEYYVRKKYSDNPKQATRKLCYLGTCTPRRVKEKLNKKRLVIASCAYMVQRKRLDLIIKVVAQLAKTGIEVKWIHIGNGDMENQIKELAMKSFSGTDVEYVFTGKMPDEEIYNLYYKENVDFFINMSDSEGVPVSIIEALSVGIIAIARDVGGNSDAVIDGYNGILIRKDEIKEEDLLHLSKKITDIFRDEGKYMQLSENARNHWGSRFSGEKNMESLCRDMIDSDVIPRLS